MGCQCCADFDRCVTRTIPSNEINDEQVFESISGKLDSDFWKDL